MRRSYQSPSDLEGNGVPAGRHIHADRRGRNAPKGVLTGRGSPKFSARVNALESPLNSSSVPHPELDDDPTRSQQLVADRLAFSCSCRTPPGTVASTSHCTSALGPPMLLWRHLLPTKRIPKRIASSSLQPLRRSPAEKGLHRLWPCSREAKPVQLGAEVTASVPRTRALFPVDLGNAGCGPRWPR